MVKAYLYDVEGHDEEIDLSVCVIQRLTDKQLLWIDVERDRGVLESIASQLEISGPALSVLRSPAGSRLQNFEAQFWLSCPVAPGAASKCDRIDFLVSQKWLLTVREGPLVYIDEFREKDREETLIGGLTPAALTASLLDCHLEAYLRDVSAIKLMVDKIDGEVLGEREKRPPLAKLVHMRARVSVLRERIEEHRQVIHGLLRPDFAHIVGQPHAAFFTRLEKHFERTEDAIDRAREMVTGSFELYATRTAQDTNKLVKALTLVTVVVGMVSAMAGILGMNFDTPIPKTGLLGFSTSVVFMVLMALAVVILAWYRKWL